MECIFCVCLCMQNSVTFSKIEQEAIRFIRNTLQKGADFPSVRELMAGLGYKSPRSAAVVLSHLVEKGSVRKTSAGSWQFIDQETVSQVAVQTVNIPLVGDVACGTPILAEENIEAFIPVSLKLAVPPHQYFFLHAKGDSMDQAGIQNGDLVLIRRQNSANNGDKVVALVNDEATLKEFYLQGDLVILKPKSSNKKHQPIVLTTDFQIQGIVVSTIPKFDN